MIRRIGSVDFRSLAKPILMSTGVGTAVALLTLCIGSLVLSAADLAPSLIPTFSLLSLLIASFVAGWLAARWVGEKGMLAGALTGIGLFLVVAVGSLLFSGQPVTIKILLKLTVVVVGAAVGGVFGVNRRKKIHRYSKAQREK